jgi:hypothetical protein
MQQKNSHLSQDNSKLYEKLKFMEYKSSNSDAQFSRYADSSDPFSQFQQFVYRFLILGNAKETREIKSS